MEATKLGKEIHDWSTNLGFTLSDGSAPPSSHFSLLSATPHRRQLWKVLLESIQSRHKIEQARKQILVEKLLEKKPRSDKNPTQQRDRLDWWHAKKKFEREMEENKKGIAKLERNVMSKASDAMFENWKLAELEKQLEELREKTMVLKLLSERKAKIAEDFQRDLWKVEKVSGTPGEERVQGELLGMPDCTCQVSTRDCQLSVGLRESGIEGRRLWDETLRCKKLLLEKFSAFIEELDSREKNLMREKRTEMERILCRRVTQLKQKTTERCLKILTNSEEEKLLEGEAERLEFLIRQARREGSLNEAASHLSYTGDSEEEEEEEEEWRNFQNYTTVLKLEGHKQFLKEKLKEEEEESKDGEGRHPPTLRDFESTLEEINRCLSEEKKTEGEISEGCDRLHALVTSVKEEMERKAEGKAAEGAADELKRATGKQVDLLLETSTDAFKTGPAGAGLESPTSVRILRGMEEMAAERERLAELQRKIQKELSCVRYDAGVCEMNFRDSEAILRGVSRRADDLMADVEFVEKILRNWVEQPYRSMVGGETIEGKSLRELEEEYRRNEKE